MLLWPSISVPSPPHKELGHAVQSSGPLAQVKQTHVDQIYELDIEQEWSCQIMKEIICNILADSG